MCYNTDNYSLAYSLLLNFIYHTISYRQIKSVIDQLPGDKSFWAYTSDAHIQMAITTWCKVFGSPKEDAHYSKFSQHPKVSFNDYLLESYQYDIEDWNEYQCIMKRFRDKFVAHSEISRFYNPVPTLDMALNAAFAYDRWTREIMAPDWNENELFGDRIISWTKAIKATLHRLVR
ncbi:MAG: hypothetical protein BWY62_00846 [Firmicutes bacterium ADurb.Bin356]|nr:MAG: hypothetical protein BWY62_00846 [Firmicutes bacterium ADurb.Bin356]